jgi:mRNA interferase YafQ
MTISYSKNFIKQSKKLDNTIKDSLIERIELFTVNPLDPKLKNHSLKGKFKDYRSINITGDFRALYLIHDGLVIFDLVGTHSQLYG